MSNPEVYPQDPDQGPRYILREELKLISRRKKLRSFLRRVRDDLGEWWEDLKGIPFRELIRVSSLEEVKPDDPRYETAQYRLMNVFTKPMCIQDIRDGK